MKCYRYNIAGHLCEIDFSPSRHGEELLPSFVPFVTDEGGECLFRMKVDDCFGLVWKRKTTLFSEMKTPIDGLFLQNCLPERNDLLRLAKPDSKEVRYHRTLLPIMPVNFLKEFGAVQDDSVLSIKTIFEKTEEQITAYNRRKREEEAQRNRAAANEGFNRLLNSWHRRHRHF